MFNKTISIKMLIILSFLLYSLWSQLLSPNELDAADTEKLARIGEKYITLNDIHDMMSGLGQEMFDDKTDKIEILKEMIRIEVFSREARTVGLQGDKKLENDIARFVNMFLAKEYIKRNVIDIVTVSGQEIEEYYIGHPEEFRTPGKMKVRQIFLSVEPEASPIEIENKRAQAKNIVHLIKEGNSFALLSSEYSEDTLLIDQKGDLGYITQDALSPEYGDTVFALDVGEVSPVLRGEYGFSIFKNEDFLPSAIQTLDLAIEDISQKIRMKKTDEAFIELEKKMFIKYDVKIWENNLQDDAQSIDDNVVSSEDDDPEVPEIDEGNPVDTGLPGNPREPIEEIEPGIPGSKPSQQ